jgi:HAE1 family hydrophobic/amphiphilic exporter-1
MFAYFVNRPVLAYVISILLVMIGLLTIYNLPITQYPTIEPPCISVTTKYTGANAEVCAKAVVTTIERAINGVPGMTYMASSSGNDGKSVIQVYFTSDTDPDLATIYVQNRVSSVLDELPEEVTKAGITTEKEVNSILMYLNVYSTDTAVDESFIFNYADINILQELKRIDGVGYATLMGNKDYAMRVWLRPDRMNAYKISSDEVIKSLREQNIEAAPGKVGVSSGQKSQSLQYVLKYTGKLTTKEEYENIVLKVTESGKTLKLKDIAEIELGASDYDIISKEDGKPSAAIIVKQRPGSNARDVIANIKSKMEELEKTTFPSNIKYSISYDVSKFLDASIHEVIKTLIEAFLLVALVVFIFLQDFRSTIIPIIAVPVSLIGTFIFLSMLGFSINMLTLFALVLAIGIVVDNAIVVVEDVHVNMQLHQMSAKDATIKTMNEIGGAIISITLVMTAVLVPMAFLGGSAGVFLKQFSITLAIAIVLSAINALTLTPALCATMLKSTHNKTNKNFLDKFFDKFNAGYEQIANKYKFVLLLSSNKKSVIIVSLIVFFGLTAWLGNILPGGFIPTEDQCVIYASITCPPGATLERTEKVVNQIQSIANKTNGIKSVSSLAGYNILTDGVSSTYGMCMINLNDWEHRTLTVEEVIAEITQKTAHIKDASIQYYQPPAIPGYGNSNGFELRLIDKTGSGNLKSLEQVSQSFCKELNNTNEVTNSFSSFNASYPQYLIRIDSERAKQLGITVEYAMGNLQTLIGSYYATNFVRFGQMYKVMLQAKPNYRAQPDDILHLSVKNDEQKLVPYASFATLERVFGPEQLTRFNMFTTATITGEPEAGFSSGNAIAKVEEIASLKLPKGYKIEWSGITRDEISSGNDAIYILLVSIVFVYLILSAQYESFTLPLTVILAIPIGIAGSYIFLFMMGLQNNIYAQIANIMLVGLLGKNTILIVEFANVKEKQGYSAFLSAIEGAILRLRPILMTSFAFIAGLIPLIIANGAGAISNQTIGTAAAGGMLIGTIFGLLIVPGIYVLVSALSTKKKLQNEVI